jgi:hypothetical protein
MTTAVAFMNFPPLPEIPEALRGESVISVRGCYCGEPPEAGEELLRPWREFGDPQVDMFGVMPYQQMDMISMEPPDPLGVYTHVELLGDLTPESVDALVELAGAGSNSPLIMLELRHLGGALARPPADLSPMGRRDSKFIMFGVGATPTPEVAQLVQANLARLAEEMRPYETGATSLNFLDLDGASPERVRAAYSSEDWERLVELKDRYDPHNLFRFNRNIPSLLRVSSGRRRAYPHRSRAEEAIPCARITPPCEPGQLGRGDASSRKSGIGDPKKFDRREVAQRRPS